MTDNNRNFWQTLPRPFTVLAPMSNITDAAMRRIIARCGKPDVLFTEFVSATGLCSGGREILLHDLTYSEAERPIVAQFFGRDPDEFLRCAALARELRFDGVDINFGCPDRTVLKQGAGSGLIREPALAQEIISAAQEGAAGLPVSVKTRIGFETDEIDSWIPTLLEAAPAALTLHGRTRRQKYKGSADWKAIKRAGELARQAGVPFIGNGDIQSYRQGVQRAAESGADGVMAGRAAIGDPWFFNPAKEKSEQPLPELLEILCEHAELYEQLYAAPGIKSFANVRKHLNCYVGGFSGAKELRIQLVQASCAADVRHAVEQWLSRHDR